MIWFRHLAVFATFSVEIALAGPLASYTVANDAIAQPLEARVGDPTRGRAVVLDRTVGNCLICHSVPNEPDELFQGDIGPSLAGIGSRMTSGQIRLRIIDQRLLNKNTVMPPYYSITDLNRVATRYAGNPVLTAQQIEDVVAFLAAQRE